MVPHTLVKSKVVCHEKARSTQTQQPFFLFFGLFFLRGASTITTGASGAVAHGSTYIGGGAAYCTGAYVGSTYCTGCGAAYCTGAYVGSTYCTGCGAAYCTGAYVG